MLNEFKSPNIQKAGGMRIAIVLWLVIRCQEVWRIGKSLKELSSWPSKLSSILKFKKLQTRNRDLGSLWAGSTNTSYQPSSQLNMMINNVLKLRIYGMLSIPYSTRHSIVKSMSMSWTKLMTNLYHSGPYFQKKSSDLPSLSAIIRLLLALTNCHGVIWNVFSKRIDV